MKANEVKVGAVTIGGFIILALIISFLGAFNLFEKGYNLTVAYPGVSGLKVGNQVRYAGVPVGTVKSMQVQPNKIDVLTKINEGVQIPQGSVFTVGSDGVLGDKFVDIQPPEKVTGSFLQPNSTITGTNSKGLDEFMASSTKVLAKVEGIADALNNVFGDPEVQKSMRDGFVEARDISHNLNRFTNVMATLAEQNQGQVTDMIHQLNDMTLRMNKVAGHMESLVANADDNGRTGQNLAVMMQNLADASARVEEVSAVLSNVATDPKTSEDIKATLHNARQASDRANKMLGTLSNAKFKGDVLHSAGAGKWRSNFGVTLEPVDNTSLYLGAANFGDDTKLDLQAIRKFKNADISLGAMQGDFGVGLGYDVSKKIHLYSQFYDFDDLKIRLGAEYKLNNNLSVIGESLDVRDGTRKDVYLGMRAYF
jgi:phospholipid/cholesterol/gamma-HCH transport system substrate-binding protein